jgi:hypothetical protein
MATRAKKRAAKKKDTGIEELIDLLEAHPRLVRELIFDPAKVKRLLKSPAGRRLIPGVDFDEPEFTIEAYNSPNPSSPYVLYFCRKRTI